MTTNDTQEQRQFYAIPTTVRRNAFLQGRLRLPSLFSPRPDRRPPDAKESKARFDAREAAHGGHKSTPRKRKVHAEVTLARLTRKQRNALLAKKCRDAGVRNAAGLALAK